MKLYTILVAIIIAILFNSCNKFLGVDPPKSKISSDDVFSSDATATSAMMGVYARLMHDPSFASGHLSSVSAVGGAAADEFINITSNAPLLEFQRNIITPTNQYCEQIWSSAYRAIFEVNNILEKLPASTAINGTTKNQLNGEALFMRAFANFYLVNLFGPVPLVLTTSYETTALLPRVDTAVIYTQIEKDLMSAASFLPDAYPGANKGRPNKAAAKALLARMYLYQGKWEEAAAMATDIIENGPYLLEDNLSNVFLISSKEAIWQLFPGFGIEALESNYLSYPNGEVILHSHLTNTFQAGDKRKTFWTTAVDTISFSSKYKETDGLEPLEASIAIRLPELLLIRAEARVRLADIDNALSDLNVVHERAGLDPLSNLNSEQLLEAIITERRLEFFGEWAHRWLDLKRTGKVVEELTQTKGSFQNYMQLFPIPQNEFIKNPNLGDQNAGY